MTIGTLFTLFVTPAVYTYLARDHQKARTASPSLAQRARRCRRNPLKWPVLPPQPRVDAPGVAAEGALVLRGPRLQFGSRSRFLALRAMSAGRRSAQDGGGGFRLRRNKGPVNGALHPVYSLPASL